MDQSLDQALERAAAGDTSGAVDATLSAVEGGATPEQVATLLSDPDVIGALDSASATQVFSAVRPKALSAKQKALIAEAVSNAPAGVKKSFERAIDVYGGGFDTYVPVGSKLNVSKRRTLVAAASVAAGSAVAGATATGGRSGGDGRPSDGGDPDTASNSEVDQMRSIARRQARRLGGKSKGSVGIASSAKRKEAAGVKRILRIILSEVGPMAFTLAGAVIVLTTLSGRTQRIAAVATVIAVVLYFGHVVLEALDSDS